MAEKKLRVLHIITRLDPGGAAINTLETVARLDPARYEVDIVAGLTIDPQSEAAEFIRQWGVRCVFIKPLVWDIHPLKDLAAFFALKKIIQTGHYDIVHTHSSKAGVLGRWAAFLAGVKHIVHTPHGSMFYSYVSPFLRPLFIWAERLTASITTILIALTERGVQEHLKLKVGKLSQWRAIPSGIDFDAFVNVIPGWIDCRRKIGADEKDVVFVSVTRLEPVKGNHVLIDAMAMLVKKVPQAKLFIVGEGRERQALRDRVRRAGLEGKVIFAGFQKQVAPYLTAADVFVLASFHEGMGRAALEAMVSERAVIVSQVGGLPDLIQDEVQGLLVLPGDVEGFARAMERLALEPELRRRMAKSGWARATQQFSAKLMVERIDQLYQEIMER